MRILSRNFLNRVSKDLGLINKLILAMLLLAIPLYQKFPVFTVPGIYVRVRLEDFLILIVAIYLSIILLAKVKKVFSKNIERSMLLFWIIGLASLVSAIIVSKTIIPHIGLLHWARRIEYMMSFFVGVYLLKEKKDKYLEYILKLLIIAITLLFIYGLGQKYLNWPVIITQNDQYSKGIALRYIPGSHLTSTFAGHYDLSSYLVLVLPVLVACFFVLRGKSAKSVMLIVWFFGLWLLSNSLSRTSVASYFIAVIITLLTLKKYKEIAFVILISLLILTVSSNLFDRYLQIITVYADVPDRISSQTPKPQPLPVLEDRSTSIRLNVEWPRAIRAFETNPLLGSGYSSITLATDNDYLRSLGEVGLLGTGAFLLIIIWIAIGAFKVFPLIKNFEGLELGVVAGLSGAIPAVLVNAVFIDIFESSKFAITFWLLIGIFIYIIRSTNGKKII